jgi:hypothetical protein
LLHEWELWIAKTTPTLEQKAFETNVKVFSGRDKLALLKYHHLPQRVLDGNCVVTPPTVAQ